MALGCAVEADGERPGVCSLNCSKAIIGSNDSTYSIRPMNPISNISCEPNLGVKTNLDRPVLLQFMVTERYLINGQENFRPVPNLSFEPVITGELAQTYPPENVQVGDGGVLTPSRYIGITTSKYDWCSDTCGVMAIEFLPVCLPAGSTNNVDVFLHSGPLFSEGVNISIISPETQ